MITDNLCVFTLNSSRDFGERVAVSLNVRLAEHEEEYLYDEAFAEFRKTFITKGEYGGEKITLPIKQVEHPAVEFSEDSFTRDWLGAERLRDPKPEEPEMPKEEKPKVEVRKKSIIRGALETMPVFGPFISAIPEGK